MKSQLTRKDLINQYQRDPRRSVADIKQVNRLHVRPEEIKLLRRENVAEVRQAQPSVCACLELRLVDPEVLGGFTTSLSFTGPSEQLTVGGAEMSGLQRLLPVNLTS